MALPFTCKATATSAKTATNAPVRRTMCRMSPARFLQGNRTSYRTTFLMPPAGRLLAKAVAVVSSRSSRLSMLGRMASNFILHSCSNSSSSLPGSSNSNAVLKQEHPCRQQHQQQLPHLAAQRAQVKTSISLGMIRLYSVCSHASFHASSPSYLPGEVPWICKSWTL